MRFQRTDAFKGDYLRLTKRNRELFKEAVREFNAACDQYVSEPGAYHWPSRLRVKAVERAPGIFEMTWSFSGPDGRATWEWTEVEVRVGRTARRVPAVRWRRVGDHKIFRNP